MDHFLTHGRLMSNEDGTHSQPLSNNQQQSSQSSNNQQHQKHHRHYYDYILYIDMDVVIMDLDRCLVLSLDYLISSLALSVAYTAR